MPRRAVFVRTCVAAFICLFAVTLSAATLAGIVKDSSGAVVPGAVIEIAVPGSPPVDVRTDDKGSFVSPDLPSGKYTLRIQKSGFEPLVKEVELTSNPVRIDLVLTVSAVHEEVTVAGAAGRYANSDNVYRSLRSIGLGTTFRLRSNTSMDVDVAKFTFRQGTITFLQPVNGIVTGAVFAGDGQFTLTPLMPIDKVELRRRTGSEVFQENFTHVVFRFTNRANLAFVQLIAEPAVPAKEVALMLSGWQDTVRHRREQPASMLEGLLTGEDMDNVDADILASLYNPKRPPFFNAYIRGSKHKDLRFSMRERGGAIPQLDSPEEVALLNFSPEGLDDGIWYLAHHKGEYEQGIANSREERRFFAAKQFKIETVIGKNDHLTSTASIDVQALVPGERIIKFGLLPNLRVSRVTDGSSHDLHFVQESRKADGSFYAILDEPCDPAKTYHLTIEYAGDKVIHKAGEGSFYVGARESWYPSLNSFGEKAVYDLAFRVPSKYTVISIGDLKSSTEENGFAVTRWVTPIPAAVAGFNYGAYKRSDLSDSQTHTSLAGYYLPELPDYLRDREAVKSLAPGAMTNYALQVARTEVQLCNLYFGSDGFERLYITEQPNFNYGQSWPNLVYLPISAYMDSTQRYMLLGRISNSLSAFVEEVTPHEVSHQWWGHAVGWASYHDQWLSEGFAEFSAALFVEYGRGPGHDNEYRQFWDRLHKEILEKQQFGESPNDAGPLWLGLRLSSPRNELAYQYDIYPKGAYVLNMLRNLMWSQNGDKEFIEMMHDFVANHRDQPASTESFKAIAEKHMPKGIDFERNGRLDWFFNEWVYGTDIPKYDFNYELSPGSSGHVTAKVTLTQSQVGPHFIMALPLYGEREKGRWVRIGAIPISGSAMRTVKVEVPAGTKALAIDVYHEILQR